MSSPKSPVVTAFEIEQATQNGGPDDLASGLEATFPASDPVSLTSAGVPGGEFNRKTAGDADAPRVDEALNSILAHRNDPYVETREHVAALRDEARSVGYRGRDAVASIRREIRHQPMRAIGVAALVGFVYGMVR